MTLRRRERQLQVIVDFIAALCACFGMTLAIPPSVLNSNANTKFGYMCAFSLIFHSLSCILKLLPDTKTVVVVVKGMGGGSMQLPTQQVTLNTLAEKRLTPNHKKTTETKGDTWLYHRAVAAKMSQPRASREVAAAEPETNSTVQRKTLCFG